MGKSPETFPRVYVAMVEAGEAGGFLDVVLAQIADFQTREKELRGRINAALIYPAVLLDDFISRFPGGTYRDSALRLRGDILLEQKKPGEAAAEYARATAILPDGREKQAAWYSMARAQVLLGKKLEAADSFGQAVSGGDDQLTALRG